MLMRGGKQFSWPETVCCDKENFIIIITGVVIRKPLKPLSQGEDLPPVMSGGFLSVMCDNTS